MLRGWGWRRNDVLLCVCSCFSQVQFGRLLREQAAAQNMFMDGLQKSFVEPMERYTRAEYGKLAENKKAWEATEEVYVAVSWRPSKGNGKGLECTAFDYGLFCFPSNVLEIVGGGLLVGCA